MLRIPGDSWFIEPKSFGFKINNFDCSMRLPTTWPSGLIGLLSMSCDVLVGTVPGEIFQKEYRQQHHTRFYNLLSPSSDEIFWLGQQIKFLQGDWDMPTPAILAHHQGNFNWIRGRDLVLPWGMARSTEMPFLCCDYDRVLHRVPGMQRIASDRDFSKYLGIEFSEYNQNDTNHQSGNCHIELEWDYFPGPCIRDIKLVDRPSIDHAAINPDPVLDIVRLLSSGHVTIEYWADDPDQVVDSVDWFDLEYMGRGFSHQPSGGFSKHLYHESGRPPSQTIQDRIWRLWVKGDRRIDVSELVFWLNNRYNCYLDQDDGFAFIVDWGRFDIATISLSQICVNTSN